MHLGAKLVGSGAVKGLADIRVGGRQSQPRSFQIQQPRLFILSLDLPHPWLYVYILRLFNSSHPMLFDLEVGGKASDCGWKGSWPTVFDTCPSCRYPSIRAYLWMFFQTGNTSACVISDEIQQFFASLAKEFCKNVKRGLCSA